MLNQQAIRKVLLGACIFVLYYLSVVNSFPHATTPYNIASIPLRTRSPALTLQKRFRPRMSNLQDLFFSQAPDHVRDIASIPFSSLVIGVPKEVAADEFRVGMVPETVSKLTALGCKVLIEYDAGKKSSFTDDRYQSAGAQLVGRTAAWQSNIVVKVQPPTLSECKQLKSGLLVSFLQCAARSDILGMLASQGSLALALDGIPRTPQTQPFDAISSQAFIAGQRAVLEAAYAFGSPIEGVASSVAVPPAQVLILGAGVAGMAAAKTARMMGATVYVYDPRSLPHARNLVESCGAVYVPPTRAQSAVAADGALLDIERERIKALLVDTDIVIASVEGRPVPLIDDDSIRRMQAGSVIVDMTGSNCEETEAGEATSVHGVRIIGYADLPSRSARAASFLLSRNVFHLFMHLRNSSGFLSLNSRMGEVVIDSSMTGV